MSEEEKQAIEVFKKCKIIEERDKVVITYADLNSIILSLIEKKNKTIEKQEKVIDKMAEALQKECRKGLFKKTPFYCQKNCYLGFGFWIKPMKKCSNCVKEYFIRR